MAVKAYLAEISSLASVSSPGRAATAMRQRRKSASRPFCCSPQRGIPIIPNRCSCFTSSDFSSMRLNSTGIEVNLRLPENPIRTRTLKAIHQNGPVNRSGEYRPPRERFGVSWRRGQSGPSLRAPCTAAFRDNRTLGAYPTNVSFLIFTQARAHRSHALHFSHPASALRVSRPE